MLKWSKILVPSLVLLVFWSSCQKTKEFPDTPAITFKSAIIEEVTTPGFKDTLLVTFGFTDGDGNIGSDDGSDLCATPDVFMTYFELIDGEWVTDEDNQPNLNWCIPDITPEGQDKLLEGEIETKIEYPIFLLSENRDSIKLEIRFRDRDGNVSNVVDTGLIVE